MDRAGSWIATRRLDELHAQVVVQDSGAEVSEEKRNAALQRVLHDESRGHGNGLSICRSIVEAHGGRIWAESPEEGGAVLQFTSPIAPPGVPCEIEHPTATPRGGPRPPNVCQSPGVLMALHPRTARHAENADTLAETIAISSHG